MEKVNKIFVFDNLKEYAEISGYFDENHPNWDAFQVIWNMSRAMSGNVHKDYNDTLEQKHGND